MNHGIKVIRHDSMDSVPDKAPGLLFAHGDAWGADEDETLVAYLVCSRRHDDEHTARVANGCREIHVLPPGHIGAQPLFDPDPQCVVKRTAALRRWRGVPEPALVGKE